ncbi:hypothetical protein G7Y89_g10527 [Cudoniella acicularis]|uniref:Uncharacterized protein n=1 Tax=Cudoniella acicularis TaxID=354080 RepID=A0A8H4RCK4_9HELO|nr:hypothetical protein G7Y89_g10527 [Cudoniella acicularis]
MRFSTASLILAYVAAIAVQAAPVGESGAGDLVMRSVDVANLPVRALGDFEIEERDPKKKKGKKAKAAARDLDFEIEERDPKK